jgi:predicted dithiol-disulfide oxidoreductase (DUF899 family)
VRVDKEYRFAGEDGERTLPELFDGRSQLLLYHFMFGPAYEAGCPTCTSMADTVNGALPHLAAKDVTFALVSRAPIEKLAAYKRRMGWDYPWYSVAGSDFNFDFAASRPEDATREAVAPMIEAGVPPVLEHLTRETGTDLAGYLTEAPVFDTFVMEDGAVYHTYSTTARGVEFLMGYYQILDRAPRGRDETDTAQFWIRRKDEY